MATTSAAAAAAAASSSSRSDLGLGRPSGSSPSSSTLTTSLSLSHSLSSSSSQSLSPLPLARSEYSSAAHAFIQRNPLKSLKDVEEARRLLFHVISFDDAARKTDAWVTLREKVVILWITLLVSMWKKEHGALSYDELPSSTRELLGQSTKADAFLPKLVCEALVNWAPSAADVQALRSAKPSIEVTAGPDGGVKGQCYAALPASVAASLVMAAISVEEAALPAGSSTDPSPSAVPLTRSLAETLLSAYTNALDADAKNASALSAYARVCELYAVHILGVRCGQWDYADQVVRLSLLEDEARAKLLVSLSRAQTHIVTRPQRRASAALAQQKAYEAEKQRRASEAKTRAEAEAETIDTADGATMRGSSSSGSGTARRTSRTSRPSRNGSRQSYHEDGYASGASTGPESSHASAGESEGESSSVAAARSKRATSSSSAEEGRASSEKTGFAATRANLSRDMARNRQRDEARSEEVAAPSSRAAASTTSSSGSLFLFKTWLNALKSLNLPMVVSVLAPLIVLIMSLRRLTMRRAGGGGAAVGGSDGRRTIRARGGGDGSNGESGPLVKALKRLWATARMGTQVTYL